MVSVGSFALYLHTSIRSLWTEHSAARPAITDALSVVTGRSNRDYPLA
jgi:hypothetical protein